MSRAIVYSELDEPVYVTTGQNGHEGKETNRTPCRMNKERERRQIHQIHTSVLQVNSCWFCPKNAQMCQIKVGSSSQHKELQTQFERDPVGSACTPESDCRMCTCTYELDKIGERSCAVVQPK